MVNGVERGVSEGSVLLAKSDKRSGDYPLVACASRTLRPAIARLAALLDRSIDMTASIASIVLAAGEGRRFGGQKQLASLLGRPLLEHALENAAKPPVGSVLVVLGAHAEQIEAEVDFGAATVVRCTDWSSGPGASLRTGLAALRDDVAAALIYLGDEPVVPLGAVDRLFEARRPDRQAVRALYGGRPGHPVLIERSLFLPLIAAAGEQRPRNLLHEAGVAGIECGDLGEPREIDTVRQLADLAAEFDRRSS